MSHIVIMITACVELLCIPPEMERWSGIGEAFPLPPDGSTDRRVFVRWTMGTDWNSRSIGCVVAGCGVVVEAQKVAGSMIHHCNSTFSSRWMLTPTWADKPMIGLTGIQIGQDWILCGSNADLSSAVAPIRAHMLVSLCPRAARDYGYGAYCVHARRTSRTEEFPRNMRAGSMGGGCGTC